MGSGNALKAKTFALAFALAIAIGAGGSATAVRADEMKQPAQPADRWAPTTLSVSPL
jgi:hypothetical protein